MTSSDHGYRQLSLFIINYAFAYHGNVHSFLCSSNYNKCQRRKIAGGEFLETKIAI